MPDDPPPLGAESTPNRRQATSSDESADGAAHEPDAAPPVPDRTDDDDRRRALGRAVAMRRVELGLRRRGLAERAGLSTSYLAEIERGAKRPSARALEHLAHALELRTPALLARADRLLEHIRAERGPSVDQPAAASVSTRPSDVEALRGAGGDLGPLADELHDLLRPAVEREVRDLVQRELDAAVGGGGPGRPVLLDEDGLRAAALETARELAPEGEQPAVDDDGDISLRRGDVMLYIRTLAEPPALLVFAPMLIDVPETTAVLERVNDLNVNLHFVRVCVTRGSVIVDLELFGEWFHPELLALSCGVVTEVAADLGPELQQELGGRLFFGEELPPPRRDTGGYL